MAQTPWGLTISHSLQINKSHSRHWSFYNLNTPVNLLKWWAIEENNRKAAIKWELKHKYRQTGGKFEKEAGDSKVMVQGLFCFPIFYFLFCKCCIEMEFKGTKWDANLCLRCYNQSELCLYEGFTANQNNGNDLVSVGTLSPSKNGKKNYLDSFRIWSKGYLVFSLGRWSETWEKCLPTICGTAQSFPSGAGKKMLRSPLWQLSHCFRWWMLR